MSKSFVIELTHQEAETVWNAMEYAFEGLDSDMSLGSEERAELRKLEELKDRIKQQLDGRQSNPKVDAAIDSMFGDSLEKLDRLTVREGRKGDSESELPEQA